MKKNTIDDYGKSIRAKYEEAINIESESFLVNLTPAGLKNLCLILLDNISTDDMKAYKHFFLLKDGVDVRKQIDFFGPDKFKVLCYFLKGSTKKSSQEKLDFIAVLVDFEPRPFSKFRKAENHIKEDVNREVETNITPEKDTPFYLNIDSEELLKEVKEPSVIYEAKGNINTFYDATIHEEEPLEVEHEKSAAEETIAKEEIEVKNNIPEPETVYQHETQGNENKHEVAVIPQKFFSSGTGRNNFWANSIKFFGIVAVVAFAIVIYGGYFNENECMTWKDDHYEILPCNGDEVQSMVDNSIIVANKELIKYQRKIIVRDTTTFFNPDNTPRLWYSKSADKKYEFFTYPGKHPLTGKSLKDVTPYIVNKYRETNKAN